jgi:Na+-translocating ferredoxin:NAD+ oxidoreductase RnfD subunit
MAAVSTDTRTGALRAPFFRTPDRYYVSVAVLAACVIPLYIMATGWLGYRVLVLLSLACAVGASVEIVSAKLTKRPISYLGIGTWLIFPFLVPPGLPLWMAALGLALSLVIAQTLFGGFGKQMVHPAVFGQLVILISFPMQYNSSFLDPFRNPFIGFSSFTSTSLTSTTEFDLFGIGMRLPLPRMLAGPHVGLLGEMLPAAVIVAGLVYVVFADVNLRTPIAFLVSMVALSAIGSTLFPDSVLPVGPAVLGGSTLFYGLFIFSDHLTSTRTRGGRIIAGVAAALITIVVRSYSSHSEGIMFAAIFTYTFGVLYDEIVLTVQKKRKRYSL